MSIYILLLIISLYNVISYQLIKNTNIRKTIDLRSQIELITLEIQFNNIGNEDLKYYELVLQNVENLSYIETQDKQSRYLINEIQKNDDPTSRTYHVFLINDLAPSKSTSIRVGLGYMRTLKNLPSEFTSQSQTHLVILKTNEYFYSPYLTISSTLKITLPSNKVESFTQSDSVSHKGDTITYISSNYPPFSIENISIHYPTTFPFARITRVDKFIDVSMWGAVSFAEDVKLINDGPTLAGTYSRLDFQKSQLQGGASFRNIAAILHHNAREMYYRDLIGNISTSVVQQDQEVNNAPVIVHVLPRFPMFGGWKSDFTFGWDVPASNLVSHVLIAGDSAISSPDRYMLNVTFGSVFVSAVVDQAVVRIMLPQGATDIEFVAPFDFDEVKHTVSYNFLDTTGHPTIELTKNNVVSSYHNRHIQIMFSVSSTAIWMKPLVLSGLIFCLFLLSMILMRIDMSDSNKDKKESILVDKKVKKNN